MGNIQDCRRQFALLSVKISLDRVSSKDATNFRTMFHDARNRNGIGEKIARREREERRRCRMDGTIVVDGICEGRQREQGVHLLETCSLYPLLIERSALGSTGVDWTHQQPLTVAPSRRPLPPTPPYVRKNICMCLRVCVRA